MRELLGAYAEGGLALVSSPVVSVWLPQTPPTAPTPIELSLLLPPFERFLFETLPDILAQPHDAAEWHLGPRCEGCRFEPECRDRGA